MRPCCSTNRVQRSRTSGTACECSKFEYYYSWATFLSHSGIWGKGSVFQTEMWNVCSRALRGRQGSVGGETTTLFFLISQVRRLVYEMTGSWAEKEGRDGSAANINTHHVCSFPHESANNIPSSSLLKLRIHIAVFNFCSCSCFWRRNHQK